MSCAFWYLMSLCWWFFLSAFEQSLRLGLRFRQLGRWFQKRGEWDREEKKQVWEEVISLSVGAWFCHDLWEADTSQSYLPKATAWSISPLAPTAYWLKTTWGSSLSCASRMQVEWNSVWECRKVPAQAGGPVTAPMKLSPVAAALIRRDGWDGHGHQRGAVGFAAISDQSSCSITD